MGDEYLVAKYRAHCVEEGDCLIWQRGKGKLPQVTVGGKKVNIRKLIATERGDRMISGAVFGCSCMTEKCIAPAHIRQRNRSQHGEFFGALGAYSGPLKIAKMAATKRAKSKLDDEKVAAIRASSKTALVLSAEYGVAASYITSIRNGNLWKNYASPFAGLGAR
jgi:hypothetical protein